MRNPIETVFRLVLGVSVSMFFMALAVVVVLWAKVAWYGWYCWRPNGKVLHTWFKSGVADAYWTWMIGFFEHWARVEVRVYGDELPLREGAFVISNHVAYVDWVTVFMLAMRHGRLGTGKFFVKDIVKYVPGIGYGMATMDMIFLRRTWADDAAKIRATFARIKEDCCDFWLINFAEGTRNNPTKWKSSNAWAAKQGFPHLRHLLHPRPRGFVATVGALRDHAASPALYDTTLAYTDMKPPSLSAMVMGDVGTTMHIHVRRHAWNDLPREPEALAQWLRTAWQEKDALLHDFAQRGSFPNPRPNVRFTEMGLGPLPQSARSQ